MTSFHRSFGRYPRRISTLFSNRAAKAGRRVSRHRKTLTSFDQLEPRLAFAVGYATTNDWGSGLQGQLTVTNDTAATLTDWQLTFNYNRTMNSIWNAQIVSHTGSQYVIKGLDWDRTLIVSASQGVGFTAGPGTDAPTNFLLTAGSSSPTAPKNLCNQAKKAQLLSMTDKTLIGPAWTKHPA